MQSYYDIQKYRYCETAMQKTFEDRENSRQCTHGSVSQSRPERRGLGEGEPQKLALGVAGQAPDRPLCHQILSGSSPDDHSVRVRPLSEEPAVHPTTSCSSWQSSLVSAVSISAIPMTFSPALVAFVSSHQVAALIFGSSDRQ